MPPPATIPDKPNGGVASPLSPSPDPPPSVGTALPNAAPSAAPPRRSRRRWAVLRVLLATLALGWWTQHAMRRHFDAGPYTGPLYVYFVDGSEERPGLMDDTGRIVVPAGEWEGFSPVKGPDGTCWLTEREVRTLVVPLDGSRPRRKDVTQYAFLDANGRTLWQSSVPLVMTESHFEAIDTSLLGVSRELGMLQYSTQQGTGTSEKYTYTFFTLEGKFILESDDVERAEEAPVLLVRDHSSGEDQRRAILWQDDHWIELARHPHLEINFSTYFDRRERDQETVLCGFELESLDARRQVGVVRGDLRWRVPEWEGSGDDGAAIANAPGSRPGDPPAYTATERTDGTWLAAFDTDMRVVMVGGLWGLQAADGQWIAEPRWTDVYEFDETTLLGIDAQGRQSIVGLDGLVHLPPVDATVTRRCVPDGGKGAVTYLAYLQSPAPEPTDPPTAGADDVRLYGWLNGQGKWVTPPVYADLSWEWLGDDESLRIGRSAETGLLGVFQQNGTQILPPRYRAATYVGGDFWYIEPVDGNTLATDNLELKVSRERSRISGRWVWRLWRDGGRIISIVDDQLPAVELKCEMFMPVDDVGYLVVRQGKVGLVDQEGRDIVPAVHLRLVNVPGLGALLASDWENETNAPLTAMDAGTSERTSKWGLLRREKNGEFRQHQLFDLRTRQWLPQTLATVDNNIAIRNREEGWGLLQADLQTLHDARALGLPAPLTSLEWFDRYHHPLNPIRVPLGTPIYEGKINQKSGLFLPDGRVLVPFVCTELYRVDARFIELTVNGTTVLMDRVGRLIAPGGETTWAALGAPGFVPLQRAAPATAGAPAQAAAE